MLVYVFRANDTILSIYKKRTGQFIRETSWKPVQHDTRAPVSICVLDGNHDKSRICDIVGWSFHCVTKKVYRKKGSMKFDSTYWSNSVLQGWVNIQTKPKGILEITSEIIASHVVALKHLIWNVEHFLYRTMIADSRTRGQGSSRTI
jgi:hypothetical protein